MAGVDAALNPAGGEREHLVHERQPGPLFGDLRHRAIDEHQLEELALLLGELVVGPPGGANLLEWVFMRHHAPHPRIEPAEALFGEGEEDVVLAREVAVDRGGAVLDPLGDLAD